MSARTRVDLTWIEGRVERWIRFGPAALELIRDRNGRAVWFEPGAIFAFVRWSANDFGTAESRIDILRAARPCEPYSSVPDVAPGGESLLRLSGWQKVEAALVAIDAVEAIGIAAEDACPDQWRHVHHRLTAGLTPRGYSAGRHDAWLKRRAIER
jgi:hypothetical protein